jgi:hypothetical protein
MIRLVEYYETNHLLVLAIVIFVALIIIIKKNQQIKKLICRIEEFETIRIENISKTIKIGSLVRLRYILTGEVITLLISENQSGKINNQSEIIRINSKMPLAIGLLNKHEGSTIKFKKNKLDEKEIYVIVLDVNNGFNSETEIVIIENDNLEINEDSEIQEKKIQPTKQTEAMEPKKNIEISKCFFIRRNRLDENIIVEFNDVNGIIWQYDHDLVYQQLKSKYDDMLCFNRYNCYTSSNTVPQYVQELDCVKIINNRN